MNKVTISPYKSIYSYKKLYSIKYEYEIKLINKNLTIKLICFLKIFENTEFTITFQIKNNYCLYFIFYEKRFTFLEIEIKS